MAVGIEPGPPTLQAMLANHYTTMTHFYSFTNNAWVLLIGAGSLYLYYATLLL